MRTCRAAVAAAVLAAVASSLAAPASRAAGEAEALPARLASIATAVRRGDAGALRDAATRGGRVRVELRGRSDAQGSYAAGQLQVVLERLFADFETRSFAFDDDLHQAEPTVFARGTWVRRPREGGAEVHDTLTFALRREQGDWRIVEIRSSP